MRELSAASQNVWSRKKRAQRRAAGLCINGYTKATNGVRCLRCYLVHKHGAIVARGMTEFYLAPLCTTKPHAETISTSAQEAKATHEGAARREQTQPEDSSDPRADEDRDDSLERAARGA